MKYRLCVFYPLDPRGAKIGGIETHVRLILSHFPEDFAVTLVGVDEIGDRTLGVAAPLVIDGRQIDFLPGCSHPAGQDQSGCKVTAAIDDLQVRDGNPAPHRSAARRICALAAVKCLSRPISSASRRRCSRVCLACLPSRWCMARAPRTTRWTASSRGYGSCMP